MRAKQLVVVAAVALWRCTGAVSANPDDTSAARDNTGPGDGDTTLAGDGDGDEQATDDAAPADNDPVMHPDCVDTGEAPQVCPSGCAYSTPSAALAAAQAGDTIVIGPGTYQDCLVVDKANITVRGVGCPRPVLTGPMADGATCWFHQGLITTINEGANLTVEHLELTGMTNDDGNGAGIRHYVPNLTVRDCYFHDGDEGMLAAADGGMIIIDNSRFERVGYGGQAHAIYIAETESGGFTENLVVRNSRFINIVGQGNVIKTRARHSLIECTQIASPISDSNYEIDACNGNDLTIRYNVIEQPPLTENPAMISYGTEANNPGTFVLENNLMINDYGDATMFLQPNPPASMVVDGNIYVGPGTWFGGTNSTHYSNRWEASLDPLPFIPDAPVCVPAGGAAVTDPSPAPASFATPAPRAASSDPPDSRVNVALPGIVALADFMSASGTSPYATDYRLGDVSTQTVIYATNPAPDIAGCYYYVSGVSPGAQLTYEVTVAETRDYPVSVFAGRSANGTSSLHIEQDGVDVSGPIAIASTGGDGLFAENTGTLSLTAGAHTLGIVSDDGGVSLWYVEAR